MSSRIRLVPLPLAGWESGVDCSAGSVQLRGTDLGRVREDVQDAMGDAEPVVCGSWRHIEVE